MRARRTPGDMSVEWLFERPSSEPPRPSSFNTYLIPRRKTCVIGCARTCNTDSGRVNLPKSYEQDPRETSRRYGLRDGACQAITQGSGEQYLSAFALLLGASPLQLSVLSALPQVIGTSAQLASVKVLRWFNDRKAL